MSRCSVDDHPLKKYKLVPKERKPGTFGRVHAGDCGYVHTQERECGGTGVESDPMRSDKTGRIM